MHPLLFEIPVPAFMHGLTGGPTLKMHTYGLFVALGFVAAIHVAWREARRTRQADEEKILDLAFWVLISAMAGSRVLFIIVNWKDYAAKPWEIVYIWKGGLVFYGGFIGAVLASWWYMRKHAMDFWVVSDLCIPTVALGQALGRLGCFAAGCCYGGVCDLPWAAHFPEGSLTFHDLAEQLEKGTLHVAAGETAFDIGVHPTQLYESFSTLLLFVGLTWLRSRKRFHGQVLLTYFIVYPIIRSIIETFRGDIERGYVIPGVLSTSQFISLCVVVAAAVIAFRLRRKVQEPPDGPLPAAA